MDAKSFYRSYMADDKLSPLWAKLFNLFLFASPNHVLEFGCGTGKHLDELNRMDICTIGIDISFLNCIKAISKYSLPCIICGDESHLRHFCNADIVFTVSVLDHIPEVEGIVEEFKRIANKQIFLAETMDEPGEFYFSHDYAKMGFEELDYSWTSPDDGATYKIWKYQK